MQNCVLFFGKGKPCAGIDQKIFIGTDDGVGDNDDNNDAEFVHFFHKNHIHRAT